jgi:hypothetical protein
MGEDGGEKGNVAAGEIAVGFCVSSRCQGLVAIGSHGLRDGVVVTCSQVKVNGRRMTNKREHWRIAIIVGDYN